MQHDITIQWLIAMAVTRKCSHKKCVQHFCCFLMSHIIIPSFPATGHRQILLSHDRMMLTTPALAFQDEL